jgi:hypothetical protein
MITCTVVSVPDNNVRKKIFYIYPATLLPCCPAALLPCCPAALLLVTYCPIQNRVGGIHTIAGIQCVILYID